MPAHGPRGNPHKLTGKALAKTKVTNPTASNALSKKDKFVKFIQTSDGKMLDKRKA